MNRFKQYQRYVGRKFSNPWNKFFIKRCYKPRGTIWYFECVDLDNNNIRTMRAIEVIRRTVTWEDSLFDKYKANLLKE
jgi:hypothetical protein